ncbi:hypothetical protein THMIRHAS_00360 [Thiosulfatimonas sediminis]|uniref:Tryptophan synthase subunit beta like protein n=1 Tax=Thiosulfatimonas sediminis TaxID=2675054 RepID=A0A6F8PRA8_9GAMM|nr:hypothetical protein [Thiosulfatimonas sediminis]BBP44663.1 hypothetical protein THMIRHAS_00360 [Thiosulfatimonas sediminis]
MLYVKKDADGRINEIEFSPESGFKEISITDAEVSRFIAESDNSQKIIFELLNRLDLKMIRSIEDIVQILIDKDLMLVTDLPEPVQNIMLFKKRLRHLSQNNSPVFEDDDMIQL